MLLLGSRYNMLFLYLFSIFLKSHALWTYWNSVLLEHCECFMGMGWSEILTQLLHASPLLRGTLPCPIGLDLQDIRSKVKSRISRW